MSTIFISLLSGILFIVGVILWIRNTRLMLIGKKTKATVIKNVEARTVSTVMWYPVISFRNQDDQLVSEQLTLSFSPAQELGSKLDIIYNPNDNSDITINNNLFLIVVPRLLTIVGLTSLIATLLDIFDVANVFP